jgi:BioD-like phosphotransacetylase family protein
MTTIIVASAQPGVGRSLIAAAIAYRHGREGKSVTLARIVGDEGAAADAAVFAALEGVVTPGAPVQVTDIERLTGEVILEAPAGAVKALAAQLNAKVLAVATPAADATDAPPESMLGTILTSIPASDADAAAQLPGVIAVMPEDRILAAPSVADIAAALASTQLSGDGSSVIERLMIGTVSSDAAAPYFGNRERTCVVTRFDKTDIQLAALNTDLQCLVLTGGGEPSPYLLDRVAGHRPDVAVLLAQQDTVDSVRVIEPLFGKSRFAGEAKLRRAVELLDAAGLVLEI